MSHEQHEFWRLEHLLRRMERKLNAILEELDILIVEEAEENAVKSITVDIGGKSHMNTVLNVGQTAQATAHGWSGLTGTGSELPLVGPVSFASDDPSVATVDPSSGLITAVGPSKLDSSNNPIPVNITATDAATGLSNPPGDATVTDAQITVASVTVTIAPN